MRTSEGVTVKESVFFALASDSSTDQAANKQELVYTRTVCMGKSRTAFLGLQDLQDGSAVGILAAYKEVMLRAGLWRNGLAASSGTCLGQEYDAPEVREREDSEWPPDF